MKAFSYKIPVLMAFFVISPLVLANPPCESSFTKKPPKKEALQTKKEALQTKKDIQSATEIYFEIVSDNIKKQARHLLEFPPSDLKSLKKLAGQAMREGEQREQLRWLKIAFKAKEESVLKFLLDHSEITNPDQKQLFIQGWLNKSVTTYYSSRDFARDYKLAINKRLGKPKNKPEETKVITKDINKKFKSKLPSELYSAIVGGDISSFLAVFKNNEYSISELRAAEKLVRSSLTKPLVKAHIERKKLRVLASMIELVDPITHKIQTNDLVKALLDEDLNFIKQADNHNLSKYELREIKIALILAEGQEDQVFQHQNLKLMIYYLKRMESKKHANPVLLY